jgi:hypothetical protein
MNKRTAHVGIGIKTAKPTGKRRSLLRILIDHMANLIDGSNRAKPEKPKTSKMTLIISFAAWKFDGRT